MFTMEKEITRVYIVITKGLKHQVKVIHLKKSFYGLIQSPRNWFLHLKEKFAEVGCTQSEYGACLLVPDRVI
jgi:hypothetical protein